MYVEVHEEREQQLCQSGQGCHALTFCQQKKRILLWETGSDRIAKKGGGPDNSGERDSLDMGEDVRQIVVEPDAREFGEGLLSGPEADEGKVGIRVAPDDADFGGAATITEEVVGELVRDRLDVAAHLIDVVDDAKDPVEAMAEVEMDVGEMAKERFAMREVVESEVAGDAVIGAESLLEEEESLGAEDAMDEMTELLSLLLTPWREEWQQEGVVVVLRDRLRGIEEIDFLHRERLKDFFEKPHTGAIRPFDEDGGIGERVSGEIGDSPFDIGKREHTWGGQILELGTDESYKVEMGGGGAVHHGAVLVETGRAQLLHTTEQGNLMRSLKGIEIVEDDLHTAGRSIVTVEDERVAFGMADLRSVVGGKVSLQGLLDVEKVDAKKHAHSGSGHSVVKIIVAEEVRMDGVDLVVVFEIALHQRLTCDKDAFHLGIGRAAVGDHRKLTTGIAGSQNRREARDVAGDLRGDVVERGQLRSKREQQVVVGIDKDGATTSSEEAVELGLGMDNSFKRAEALEVGLADIGDKAKVGLSDSTQGIDLARMAGSHFDDSHLGIGRDSEDGERDAEMIVEITSGGMGAILAREDGKGKFLGGSFAVGAGDADKWNRQLLSVVTREVLQSRQDIGDEDTAVVEEKVGVADDAKSGTVLQSLFDKRMTVDPLALESKEE